MAQEYKITSVIKRDEWSNDYGTFQSYALALEGIGEPVQMNKAVPVKQEPQIGDTLYGNLQELTSKNGNTYFKFKSERRTEGSQGYQRDDASIKAQFAIKCAVRLLYNPEADIKPDLIEHWANTFFNMVDRVKEGKPVEKVDAVVEVPDKVLSGEEEIDLKDIPF